MQCNAVAEVLHTRHIEIDNNLVANVIRDTSDAGALEYVILGVSRPPPSQRAPSALD